MKNNFIFPWMKKQSPNDSWWLLMRVRMTVMWAMIPQGWVYLKNFINRLVNKNFKV